LGDNVFPFSLGYILNHDDDDENLVKDDDQTNNAVVVPSDSAVSTFAASVRDNVNLTPAKKGETRRSSLSMVDISNNLDMTVTRIASAEELCHRISKTREQYNSALSTKVILYHYTNPTFANSILTHGLKMSTQV
jgi:hypothetical protein